MKKGQIQLNLEDDIDSLKEENFRLKNTLRNYEDRFDADRKTIYNIDEARKKLEKIIYRKIKCMTFWERLAFLFNKKIIDHYIE